MNAILNVSWALTKSGLPMNERLSEAGIMVVKGTLMVFAVLAVLMFVLMLMERFFNKKPEQKKAEPAPVPAPAVVEIPAASPEPVVEDDGAIVAAISAAIAVMLAEGGYTGGFRVVSFKRADRRSAWNTK